MQHSDAIVKAATEYVFRLTFGDPRMLLALPKTERDKCLRCLAIVKQANEAKGVSHGEPNKLDGTE